MISSYKRDLKLLKKNIKNKLKNWDKNSKRNSKNKNSEGCRLKIPKIEMIFEINYYSFELYPWEVNWKASKLKEKNQSKYFSL